MERSCKAAATDGLLRWRRIAVVAIMLTACAPVRGSTLADEPLEGPDSVYTGWLADVLRRWPASRPVTEDTPSVQLDCISNAADERYVGMLQQMTVAAPLAAVEAVLDDVTQFKHLFPGVVDVHVLPGSRDGRRYTTSWEQRVPVFFLPNVVYELANLVDKSAPDLRIYRYKLRRAGPMRASDGMVLLEADGTRRTRFTEYDFFNADWGPLPASAVWRESLRDAFAADMAIKLRAENPDWPVRRVAAEAEARLGAEADRIEQCFRGRRHAALNAQAP